MVDTSVLVAGIAGLKSPIEARNLSARFLREWVEGDTFVWLVSEAILDEYKGVLGRLGIRRSVIGNIVNLLREEAEFVDVRTTPGISPDPADDPFCGCAEQGRAAFIVTLNPKDFPQKKLRAKVIAPGDAFPTTAPRRTRDKSFE